MVPVTNSMSEEMVKVVEDDVEGDEDNFKNDNEREGESFLKMEKNHVTILGIILKATMIILRTISRQIVKEMMTIAKMMVKMIVTILRIVVEGMQIFVVYCINNQGDGDNLDDRGEYNGDK